MNTLHEIIHEDEKTAQNADHQLMVLIRRLLRNVSKHSKYLLRKQGLTAPQLLILNHIQKTPGITPSQLAIHTNTTQATVSNILERLENKKIVVRTRSAQDRRSVQLFLSPYGHSILSENPLLLQQQFLSVFNALPFSYQQSIINSFQTVVYLMDIAIDATEPDYDFINRQFATDKLPSTQNFSSYPLNSHQADGPTDSEIMIDIPSAEE